MDRNPIVRKCLAVGIIFLFVGTGIISSVAQNIEKSVLPTSRDSAQKTNINRNIIPGGDFGLQSIIDMALYSNGTDFILVPGGEPRIITLYVTYHTLHYNPFSHIILLYCLLTHQYVDITLEITNIPSWCKASLSNSQLQFPITRTESSQLTTLSVAVDEYAPAYEQCLVLINVSGDTMLGPFGFLPFVNEFYQIFCIDSVVGYRPQINVTPQDSYLETTQGTTVFDLITVKNLGNGDTIVQGDVVILPVGWVCIINPSQLVLEVNESKTINIAITPPMDFYGIETIIFPFTPYYRYDFTNKGTPILVTICVEVKP